MSSPPAATERYDSYRHDTPDFESGNEALDRWLIQYAGQSERRDAARTFVLTDARVVIGYYAIDEPAARFYEHFGFRALSAIPRTLTITLAELRAAGYP